MADWIKLSDYANERGVTERAIRYHIKKYEKDLTGHVEKRSVNMGGGTWIDATGIEIIDQHIKQNLPISISDSSLITEVESLQAQIISLQASLITAQERLLTTQEALSKAEQESIALKAAVDDTENLKKQLQELSERAEKAEQQVSIEAERLSQLTEKSEVLMSKTAALEKALAEEQNRKLSFRERISGRKLK